ARVERGEQPEVEYRTEIERRHAAKQEARHREVLDEHHQPVDRALAEEAGPRRGIAPAHHEKDRQDDDQKLEDQAGNSSTRPSWAGTTCSGVSLHSVR